MITMTVQAPTWEELIEKMRGLAVASVVRETAPVPMPVRIPEMTQEEVETAVEAVRGKRGRPKKESTPVEAVLPPASTPVAEAPAEAAGATSGPAAVPPGGAPVTGVAIEPTEENMRKLLQTFVGKAKTADIGAEEVGKMFVRLFGVKEDGSPKILRVKDVPADRRADVIAEVQKVMAV